MKESPVRYINPFLSDKENDKVKFWKDDKVNFMNSLKDEKFGKSLAPPDVPSEYIDKNVTECKLPEELVACYEENGFNVVKDICVNEGLSHGEKIETVNDDKHDDMIKDEKLISTSLEDDCCKNGYVFSVAEDDSVPTECASEESKLKYVESNVVKSSENCGPDMSMQTGEENIDSKSDSLNSSSNDDVNQYLPEAPSAGSAADVSNKIEMEENTTSNSKNRNPATISDPHELPIDSQTAPEHHDISSDYVTVAINQLQHGGGESSFSMAGPVSGLITYAGPISSAGSISHRSDCSNTSVRSFAFPILQNDWNSSPVRMAKVDKRQSQKHRGWRQAFMCCGF